MELANNIFKNAKNAMAQTYSLVSTAETVDTSGGLVADGRILLEFDTIDECKTTGSATVTKYPTELGIYKTDYKYRNPDTVRMVGIIAAGGATGYASVLKRIGTWDRQSAIESIRGNLKILLAEMTLLNIQTRNAGRRDNMTLSGYEINETYDNSGTLEVTMQFTEVPTLAGSSKQTRAPSDDETQESGIVMTQTIAAGALVAGSAILANLAAL